jgi:hypothetical protein
MFLSYLFFLCSFSIVQTLVLANNHEDMINKVIHGEEGKGEVDQDKKEEEQQEQEEQLFSKLTFDVKDEINFFRERSLKEGDIGGIEEEELNSSFWGRLYIDGFPGQNGMQYFRAHFGSLPPLHRVTFRLGQSLEYCDNDNDNDNDNDLENEDKDVFDKDTIVVVKRGNCPFSEKAQRAFDSGAGGILFINNEVGEGY